MRKLLRNVALGLAVGGNPATPPAPASTDLITEPTSAFQDPFEGSLAEFGASNHLEAQTSSTQRSAQRLSSGNRITQASDDVPPLTIGNPSFEKDEPDPFPWGQVARYTLIGVVTMRLLFAGIRGWRRTTEKLLEDWGVKVDKVELSGEPNDSGDSLSPYAPPVKTGTLHQIRCGNIEIGSFITNVKTWSDNEKNIEIRDFYFSRLAAEFVTPKPTFSDEREKAHFNLSVITGGHIFDSFLQLDRVLALAVLKEALEQAEAHGATGIITDKDNKLLYNIAKELELSDKNKDIVRKQSEGPDQFVRIDVKHLLKLLASMPIKDVVTSHERS